MFDLVARLRLQDDFSARMRKANNEMGKAQKETGKLSNGFKKLGGVLAGLGITASLGAIAKSVVTTGIDYTSTMQKVQAVTGATGKDMEAMSDLARQLGKDTIHSASDAAEGMAFLGQAGFETNEIMATMPGLLDLATAGALDLGAAADIASNIMTGFNMEAEEMGRISDVLAAAAASANTDVQQMGDGMSYVAPIASSMGMELEEVAAGIGLMSDAGIQGQRAGTALRGTISALSDPTTALTKKLNAAGLSAEDVSPKFNSMSDIIANLEGAGFKASDALELVGMNAGPGLAALMTAGSEELANFTKELENSEGAAKSMAETMSDHLGGDWEILKSAVAENMIAAFLAVEPSLRKVIQFASEIAAKVPAAASALMELLKPFVPLAKNIGIALAAIGSFMAIIGTIKAIGAGLAFLVSPIGLVIAGVTGLVFAFQKAYEHSEIFREKIDGVVSFVKELFNGEATASDFLQMIGLTDEQVAKLNEFVTTIQEKMSAFKDYLLEKFAELQPGIEMYMQTFEIAKETITNVFTTLWAVLQPIFSALGVAFQILGDIAVMVFNNVIAPAVQFAWTLFQTAWSIISPILQLLGALIEVTFAVLKVVWDTILKPVASFLLGQFAEALNSVTPILEVIGGAFDTLGGKISGVVTWLKDVASWFKNIKVPDWVEKIGGGISGAASKIGSFFTGNFHGADRIPYDGYLAELHRGERVLTRQEADNHDALMSMAGVNKKDNIIKFPQVDIPNIAQSVNMPKMDTPSVSNVIKFPTVDTSDSMDHVTYDSTTTNNYTYNNEHNTTNNEGEDGKSGGGNTYTFGDIHLHDVDGDMEKAADELMAIIARRVEQEGA